jgi:hypothetical protein
MEPSYATATATLVVGLSVAAIAYQQWVLARHKFRLDLYDRRYKVYEATQRFLSAIMIHGDFSHDALIDYNHGTMDAVFLYPPEIEDYINKVRKTALDMQMHGKQMHSAPVGDVRSKLVQQNHDELVWLTDQLVALPSVFTSYLGFQSVK